MASRTRQKESSQRKRKGLKLTGAGYEVLEFRSENCSLEGRVGKTAEITFKEPVGNMLKQMYSWAWEYR